MNYIKIENKKLNKAAFDLAVRRINWRVAAKRKIINEFEKAELSSKESEYRFKIYKQIFDINVNEEAVVLCAGYNFTGVVNKEIKVVNGNVKQKISSISENGCSLFISQAINGTIAITLNPYKSEKHSKNEENIILYFNLHPDDISEKLLKKCIKLFFIYARTSSIFGMQMNPSLGDSIRINYLIFKDIRNRRRLIKTFMTTANDWGKIIIAAALGYAVAIITK